MKYSAADLRHQIRIKQNAESGEIDENYNPAPAAWTSITENPIWAAKRGLSGRTYFEAAAVQAEDNILFVVRYNSTTKTVTTVMQISEGTDVYTITAPPVDVDDAHQWLEIRAKKVDVNGG